MTVLKQKLFELIYGIITIPQQISIIFFTREEIEFHIKVIYQSLIQFKDVEVQ